jgi:hypothetical protein
MNECYLILHAARTMGVPAAALVALRVVENGRPGREFGVLSVPAPTYEDQVLVAARSFRNAEQRFGEAARDVHGHYTEDFLRHFSARWAPIGAENDPDNLNSNHANNLVAAYAQLR